MSQIISSLFYHLHLNFISLIQVEYSCGSFRQGQWGSYFVTRVCLGVTHIVFPPAVKPALLVQYNTQKKDSVCWFLFYKIWKLWCSFLMCLWCNNSVSRSSCHHYDHLLASFLGQERWWANMGTGGSLPSHCPAPGAQPVPSLHRVCSVINLYWLIT